MERCRSHLGVFTKVSTCVEQWWYEISIDWKSVHLSDFRNCVSGLLFSLRKATVGLGRTRECARSGRVVAHTAQQQSAQSVEQRKNLGIIMSFGGYRKSLNLARYFRGLGPSLNSNLCTNIILPIGEAHPFRRSQPGNAVLRYLIPGHTYVQRAYPPKSSISELGNLCNSIKTNLFDCSTQTPCFELDG